MKKKIIIRSQGDQAAHLSQRHLPQAYPIFDPQLLTGARNKMYGQPLCHVSSFSRCISSALSRRVVLTPVKPFISGGIKTLKCFTFSAKIVPCFVIYRLHLPRQRTGEKEGKKKGKQCFNGHAVASLSDMPSGKGRKERDTLRIHSLPMISNWGVIEEDACNLRRLTDVYVVRAILNESRRHLPRLIRQPTSEDVHGSGYDFFDLAQKP